MSETSKKDNYSHSKALRDWVEEINVLNAQKISTDTQGIEKTMSNTLINQYMKSGDTKDSDNILDELNAQDIDALQHYYGSRKIGEEHGKGKSLISGLFHEFEGLLTGHSVPSIVSDLYNNISGIYGEKPKGTGDYEFVELMNKYNAHTHDDRNPISDDELNALKIFVGHGLEKTFNPPRYAKSGYSGNERGLLGQLIYGTDKE